jgi:hypothetical protein
MLGPWKWRGGVFQVGPHHRHEYLKMCSLSLYCPEERLLGAIYRFTVAFVRLSGLTIAFKMAVTESRDTR